MKRALILIVLLLAVVTFSQENQWPIGEIDFYGYAGLDLEKVRAALPLREGDDFSDSDFVGTLDRISAAITKVIGKPPTDIAVVCCDDKGSRMIYIGLPGKSMKNVPYNPSPKGTIRLPVGVIDLYQQTMEASSKAVQSGSIKEDDSKGYALSTAPELRAKQLATREYVLKRPACNS